MEYKFKTDFIKMDDDYLDIEDSKFLINSAYVYISHIFKVNEFLIKDGNIKRKFNLEKTKHKNGNTYVIDILFSNKSNRGIDVDISFILEIEQDKKVKIKNCIIHSSKNYFKLNVLNSYMFLIDRININLNEYFELIDYKVLSKIAFLDEKDSAFWINYKIYKQEIVSEIEYSVHKEGPSKNTGFLVTKNNITEREIVRDLEFLKIIYKYNENIINVFPYIDLNNINIEGYLKRAYILFKEEDLKEINNKLMLLEMLNL